MASSLSRRLLRTVLLSSHKGKPSDFAYSFCTKTLSSSSESSDAEEAVNSVESDDDSILFSSSSTSSDSTENKRVVVDRPLEDGLDVGVYKVHLLPETQLFGAFYLMILDF